MYNGVLVKVNDKSFSKIIDGVSKKYPICVEILYGEAYYFAKQGDLKVLIGVKEVNK